jgi:hypothetical protein
MSQLPQFIILEMVSKVAYEKPKGGRPRILNNREQKILSETQIGVSRGNWLQNRMFPLNVSATLHLNAIWDIIKGRKLLNIAKSKSLQYGEFRKKIIILLKMITLQEMTITTPAIKKMFRTILIMYLNRN